ncbi:MAG: hypothetical protein JXR96_16550 [Deltaproteobacteria bacterium]|nr:hypothetical protein [Deltaproteobacteria bacterium]
MVSGQGLRIVVTDASVVINLVHVDRLPMLSSLEGLEFVITDEVLSEVKDGLQARALRMAMDDRNLGKESLETPAELRLFAGHVQVMGRGEASCLALAESRGYLVACDERRKFLAVARERLGEGRVVNTPGLFVLAIRRGFMTVDEADADKQALESHRFRMKFTSFRGVVGGDVKRVEDSAE